MNKLLIMCLLFSLLIGSCTTGEKNMEYHGNWKTQKKWNYTENTWNNFTGGTYIFLPEGEFGILSSDGVDITSVVTGGQQGGMEYLLNKSNDQSLLRIRNVINEKIFLDAEVLRISPDSLIIETVESPNSLKERILFLRTE